MYCLLRYSQLTPMITTFGVTTSSSLSPITNELSPMFSSNEEKTISIENPSPHHLTVELNETHRRSKQSDRSPVVSYYSLLPKAY
ncbi:unnamed protein product [Rotaria sp. Silwood2]|nr:unnamed protein product [Rotaria sp. Silwood2]